MPQSYPSKPLTHGNPAFLISLARLDSVRLAFSALNRSASTPSWPGVAPATTERSTLLVDWQRCVGQVLRGRVPVR